jgi:hypothetical protein
MLSHLLEGEGMGEPPFFDMFQDAISDLSPAEANRFIEGRMQELKSLQNSLCFLNRLPEELLVDIFQLVLLCPTEPQESLLARWK